MSVFVRSFNKGGKVYYALVENTKVCGQTVQKVLLWYGRSLPDGVVCNSKHSSHHQKEHSLPHSESEKVFSPPLKDKPVCSQVKDSEDFTSHHHSIPTPQPKPDAVDWYANWQQHRCPKQVKQ